MRSIAPPPHDPSSLTLPLRHNARKSAAVSPSLDGSAMDATMPNDQLHLLPISSSPACASTAWYTPSADVTTASQLFNNLGSLQGVDMLANVPISSAAAATGEASSVTSVAQPSALLVPQALDAPPIHMDDHADVCMALRMTSATGGSAPVFVPEIAPTKAVDSVSGEVNAPHTSCSQALSPPTATEVLPPYRKGVSDGSSFTCPFVAAAAALQLLPSSFSAMPAPDTSHRTPATLRVGEDGYMQSRFSGHRTTASTPDSQQPPLTDVTHAPLSLLGSSSENSLAAGPTVLSVACGSVPAEEGSGQSSKATEKTSLRRLPIAVLGSKTTSRGTLASDSPHECPLIFSATAAATAQQCGAWRGNRHCNEFHSRRLSRGDAGGSPSVSIKEPRAAAPPLCCAVSDAVADTIVAMLPSAAFTRPSSPYTTFRQPARPRDQASPPPQASTTLLPPPTTKATMPLSASFPAGVALSLDGALRSCVDDVVSVLNMNRSPPLATAVGFGAATAAAGTGTSASLFDSSAGVVVETSAMRQRTRDGALPAQPVQQAPPAKQNPRRSPPSMCSDVLQQSVDARAAVTPVMSADVRTFSPSPQGAARTTTAEALRRGGHQPQDCGVRCMGGGVPDAPQASTLVEVPARYPPTLHTNPTGPAADTASQPSHFESESMTYRSALDAATGDNTSTPTDTSATLQDDRPHRNDILNLHSTSCSDVRARFKPMSLEAATRQETSQLCDQSIHDSKGSCCGDAIREAVKETANVATQGTPKVKRLSTPHEGDRVDVQHSAESGGTLIIHRAPASAGIFAHESRCAMQEGGDGAIAVPSHSHQRARHTPTIQSPTSCSIAAVVAYPSSSTGGGSPIPLVATTTPLSAAVAHLPLTVPQPTSAVVLAAEESRDAPRLHVVTSGRLDNTQMSRHSLQVQRLPPTPQPAARTLAPPSSIGSAAPLPHHTEAATDSMSVLPQPPVPGAAPPVQSVANSQTLLTNTRTEFVARSSVAAREAPSPMPTISNSKSPPIVETAHDVPVATAARRFPQLEMLTVPAVDHAHRITAASPPSPALQRSTAQGELAAPPALPMRYITETACVAQRYTAVSPSRSASCSTPASGGEAVSRVSALSPPCPPGAPVNASVRAIAAPPYVRDATFKRRHERSTPRSARYRGPPGGSRGDYRAAAHAVSAASAAPPSSFAHVTDGEQVQMKPCRLLMCSSSPPGPPARRPAHAAPLPVCIAVDHVTASLSGVPETIPPCRPLDVRDAGTEGVALSIIPASIGTSGSNVSSPAESELLGVLMDWTPTRLAVSQQRRTAQQEAAEMKVVCGANLEKQWTERTPRAAAAVPVPATQAQALNRRTTLHTGRSCVSNTAATSANPWGGDTRGVSAASALVHHDCQGAQAVLQRVDRRGTVAVTGAPHTSLPARVVPVADSLLSHPTPAPQEHRAPPIYSHARGGEVPGALGPITRLPTLWGAAAAPCTRNGRTESGVRSRSQTTTLTLPTSVTTAATHPLPLPSGPSWERIEPLPVEHLPSATPTATLPMARTFPLDSVPSKKTGTPPAVPHRVRASPSLSSCIRQQRSPREAVFTSPKPAPVQHPACPAAAELLRQASLLTAPRQRGEGTRNEFASGMTLAASSATSVVQQLACGAASGMPQGAVTWEVLPGTHCSGCGWVSLVSSYPSSAASSCLQRRQLQTGCRSGLPRSLPFLALTPDPMGMAMLSSMPEAAMPRPFSTEAGGHGRRQARPLLWKEPQATQRSSPFTWSCWRGRHTLTSGQRLPERLQPHVHGARTGDFLVELPSNPDMVGDADNAALPRCRPTLSCRATAVAAGRVGTVGDGGELAAIASPIPAAPPSLGLHTVHPAATPERLGGRAGAAAEGDATSGYATAGQPLHRVVAIAPPLPPATAATTEAATSARTYAESVLTRVSNHYSACQHAWQLPSTQSGLPPPSQVFYSQSSQGTGSQSPQDGRGGEARGITGTVSGPRSLPAAEAGMALLHTTAAVDPSEPSPRYPRSRASLQRYNGRTNAALRGADGAINEDKPQRAPRLTRALLDRLQRSHAATAAASSRPHHLPSNLLLEEALVADWHDATQHSSQGGNGASSVPAMAQRPRLSSLSRGRSTRVPAVLPSSEWAAAYSNPVPASPPPQLHAAAGSAPTDIRAESLITVQPEHTAAVQQEPLYRQPYPSPSFSPDPVAPPPAMRDSQGAVLRAPYPQGLSLLVPSHQAPPRRLRRNLVEQPARKPAAHKGTSTANSGPVGLAEMTLEPAKALATPSPLALLEHQRTPVLTAITIVPPAPRPGPWVPEGNRRGLSTEVQSTTETYLRQGSSVQRIRSFFRVFRARQEQRRGGRVWVAH
ncbi:hypothetical protein Q4I32_002520 [Leishmania shawi]|uniref:Uncharacterized protein n=1 Tax=Leishmania shawi TaxID=5680 RepID=A0AAW3C2R1_9TRYP